MGNVEVESHLQQLHTLWAAASRVAYVHYFGTPSEEAGSFHPTRAGGKPDILLSCPGYEGESSRPSATSSGAARTEAALLQELLVLAHEFGHALSWKRGQRSVTYEQALDTFNSNQPLSNEQVRLIRDEEERADLLGREQLELIGFTKWEAWDELRERSNLHYEARFAQARTGERK